MIGYEFDDDRLDDEYQLRVTPSENKFFKFTFPQNVNQVAVVSKSYDDVCMIVSVQSPQVIALQSSFYSE